MNICLSLTALLTNVYLPYNTQFADELLRQTSMHEEVCIEHVEKQHAMQIKQLINRIPGIVVRRMVYDDDECEITVGKIYGH